MGKRWWVVIAGVLVVGVWSARDNDEPKAAPRESVVSTKPTPKPATTPQPAPADRSVGNWYDDYDPAHFAVPVRKSAKKAGISPQLLMAILYNEDYKPHTPELERSWQRIKPDASFGIANMHRAAFDQTKRGRFAKRQWEELPDHPELAIEAAAWHLHDLANRLPTHRKSTFTKDELLALGYNTGAGNMRAFARGAHPGAQAQTYLDRLHANWDKSGLAARQ
ncbi:lytic transglycosylase domain-containing protein [Kribbella antibiotica]|uniref:Lytic transglycosylase domain-containing protein n=1 Tax=Kribbella antibiotica TaxID=190195 RepID=A0A4R4ZWH3_9ACTN|nr:transglycosylase SLT domain-containing protein [Kribbella antibiotica]TDD62900.1 lytic transglycosylase domain-containing protein [Kribbella antibiotica]